MQVDLSDYLSQIDIYAEWLGWAQPIAQDGRKIWKLHEPAELWRAIKDSLIEAGDRDYVSLIATGTKARPPESRFYYLKQQLSDEAIALLANRLKTAAAGKPRAIFPEPEIEPLTDADVADFVEIISFDEEGAIALLEGLPPEHQAQIAEALSKGAA
jgi:hypothetical protein